MFKVSFIVDDKKLPATLRALGVIGVQDLLPIPMLNAEVQRGEIKPRHGSASEAFIAEMQRMKLDKVNPTLSRQICGTIGCSPTSYFHVVADAVKKGLLHKGEKDSGSNGYFYVITKQLPSPGKHKGGK